MTLTDALTCFSNGLKTFVKGVNKNHWVVLFCIWIRERVPHPVGKDVLHLLEHSSVLCTNDNNVIHNNVNACLSVCPRVWMHVHMWIHPRMSIRIYRYARTHTHTDTHTYTPTHTCTNSCMHACINMYTICTNTSSNL